MRTIDERLRLAQYRDKFNLESSGRSNGDILDAMLRYKPDIVHFSGHGDATGTLDLRGCLWRSQAGERRVIGRAVQGARGGALRGDERLLVQCARQRDRQIRGLRRWDGQIGGRRGGDRFRCGVLSSLCEGKSVGKAFDLGKVQIMLDGGTEQSTPRLKTRSGVNPASVTFA